MTKKLTWTLTQGFPEQRGIRELTRDQIGVVFQPIVDISNGGVFAFEALVRCTDARYPNPPALFDAAVKEEACGRLGRVIREVAFSTCGANALFVNLHPQELASRWLVQADDPIAFHDHDVFLEITEVAAFTHYELCASVLKDVCRRTGARIVIDDFGAGYSNLERVADLSPAVVKLDLALTRDVHRHKAKQVVIRHMVNMCRELGAVVVGEGIEQVDELRCIADLGVSYAQGYLLARPAAPPPRHTWPLRKPTPPPRKPSSRAQPRTSDRPLRTSSRAR